MNQQNTINQKPEKIIGCACRVYNKLGYGILESVYEKSLLIELDKIGINTEAQKPVKVYYENVIVGEFVTDLLVENSIIVELKSVNQLVKAHEIQMVNYLTAIGKNIASYAEKDGTFTNTERRVQRVRKVISRRGEVKAQIKVTDVSPKGVISMTFHFAESPTNVLTSDAIDPVAKIPETKVCAVRLEKT